MTYQFVNNCQFRAEDLDRIYTEAFGPDKTDGWFVEVGASNGQDHSNTALLADAGWSGLYIEPVKVLAKQCRQRHESSRIVVLNMAVGTINGLQPMWLIPGWGTATSNYKAALAICEKPEVFLSTVKPLDWVLGYALADLWMEVPTGFELLVIDVDFGEIDVLKGFDIGYWKPKLVIIELHEESQHPLSEEVRQFALPYFKAAGYEKIYTDHINTIFRSNPVQ